MFACAYSSGEEFRRLLADHAFGRGGVEWDKAAITIPAPLERAIAGIG